MSPDEQKPLSPDEKRLLADALAFALWAHGDQTRKGSNIPYASHLLQVAGLVLEHGGDVHQAVAGLLHDTVEDCDGVTPEIVEDRFGKDVARIVECAPIPCRETPRPRSRRGAPVRSATSND